MINKTFNQYKKKCIRIREFIKLLYRDTDITISNTPFLYTKNNFQLSNLYIILNKQLNKLTNQNTHTKIYIKKWLVHHKFKIIQILNLLHDCYTRIINLNISSIENTKLERIIIETKQILIDDIVQTHKLGVDDGSELNSTLPFAPSSALPKNRIVRKVSKPIPIPIKNKKHKQRI